MVLFVTKHWHVLQILSQYNIAMGCSPHVFRYDLIITDRMGRLHPYLKSLCTYRILHFMGVVLFFSLWWTPGASNLQEFQMATSSETLCIFSLCPVEWKKMGRKKPYIVWFRFGCCMDVVFRRDGLATNPPSNIHLPPFPFI